MRPIPAESERSQATRARMTLRRTSSTSTRRTVWQGWWSNCCKTQVSISLNNSCPDLATRGCQPLLCFAGTNAYQYFPTKACISASYMGMSCTLQEIEYFAVVYTGNGSEVATRQVKIPTVCGIHALAWTNHAKNVTDAWRGTCNQSAILLEAGSHGKDIQMQRTMNCIKFHNHVTFAGQSPFTFLQWCWQSRVAGNKTPIMKEWTKSFDIFYT